MDAKIDAFLRYLKYEKNYSALTIQSYREDLLQYERFVTDETGEFQPLHPDLDLVRAWMADMGRQRAAVSSVKRRICALRSFYKYLHCQKLIDSNPLLLLSSPKVPKVLPVWVPEDQMDYVIDEEEYGDDFSGVRDRLVIDMLYSTGMRRAEMAGLQDKDIDFQATLIKVTGKGNKERLIPFGPELATMIQSYIELRNKEFGTYADTFFLNNKGKSLSCSQIYNIVTLHLSQLTTLAKRSPHVLRHSFATNMLSNGADLMAIKELLGHASLQSTEVYTHLSPKELLDNYKQAHPRAIKDKTKGD